MTSSLFVRLGVSGLLWLTASGQSLLAQDTTAPFRAASASEALQVLLDRNIAPAAGPLTGDGATIAGVLAGQSLTFPMASSSGAFVTVNLHGFGPAIPVSTSGSFGPLFAERALTNGRGNLSLSINFQHKTWRSMAGINLRDFALKGRSVFRHEVDGSPAGTAEEFAADIDFQTDVLVLAANYGVFSFLDAGVSVPYVRSTVKGVKQRVRTIPGGDVEYSGETTGQRELSGSRRCDRADQIPRWKPGR